MQSYPHTPSFVQPGEPLGLLIRVLTRPDTDSVAKVAADHQRSSAHVYDLLGRARDALAPGRPGPTPGARTVAHLQERVADLEGQLEQAQSRLRILESRLGGAVVLDPRRLARLELVMAGYNVPFRGMREILAVAFGAKVAPAVSTLHAPVAAYGRLGRGLLDRAREQVCARLVCITGDDVFLGGDGVKVLTEPRSNAILDLGRCPGRKAADWTRWTKEYTSLQLFISDLGTDLVGAIDARPEVRHILDYWHEMDWWWDEVFGPLDRDHKRLGKAIEAAQVALEKLHGEARTTARQARMRLERHRRRIEREFYLACEAEAQVRALYEPLDPDGALWTDARVNAVLETLTRTLLRITHDVGIAAWRHVDTNAHRYATHRVLMEKLGIELRPNSPWTAREVLCALAQERVLRRRANDMTRTVEEQIAADRQARRLGAAVTKHCVNGVQVRAQWTDLVRFPRRSTSGTESFNNRLRVLQVVQRFVGDDRMALHALHHNLTAREDGPRAGQSPYQILGVDFATPGKPWYDVLLDAAA